jgi:DNA-binding transcriptional LysR family regulator
MIGRLADVDIRLLRVFVAVAECGGFAAAQALLNISESTVSTHMSDLEARLGMRLCERGRGGFRLTGDGQSVYQATRELLASLDRFQDRVAARRQEMSGQLAIGLPDNIITHLDFRIAEAIERFYGRVNMVELTLHTLTPRELERGVLDGSMHLAIVPRHQKLSGLSYQLLFREVNYFYVGKRHALFSAATPSLELQTIAAAGLIGRGYLSRFDRKFFGTMPHSATVFGMEAAAMLVLSGRFGGFLPAHYAQRWIDSGDMKALTFIADLRAVCLHRSDGPADK